ncbi:TlpA disulfide reductase family protein [uncultured Aquimarina sp.]|uniref:TlpA family protein disulfide reductase n=1 Tax=uncultured Aquimarina sp. TaxID=575652 RepID=UPI0026231136|nr:TlpA disulfide reductase family protein [uncultured Aquimarina sp.]
MKIDIKKTSEDDIMFDPNFTDLHFQSFYELYPKFYEELKLYKGIPNVDTSLIANYNYDIPLFFYKLYSKGHLADSDIKEKIHHYGMDTSIFSGRKINDQAVVFTGFKNNKQIVILDSDNDKNFGNDRVLSFEKDFRLDSDKNIKALNKLPRVKYNYEILHKDGVTNYNRDIILYPSSNSQYASLFQGSLNKKLHITGRIKDYWKGNFTLENYKYEIAFQGLSKEYLQILIRPDSIEFSSNDFFYNKNFEYRVKDTISISNNLFTIDTINLGINEIALKKLKVKRFHGFRKGETLANYKLENLDGTKFSVLSNKDDKYILLNFWGTWCPPCVKNTPKIKGIANKHKEKLSVIGIAYDDSTELIKKYIDENKLNWRQAFIKREFNPNSILNSLRIEVFPTYILLANDAKILYRGTGSEALNEIEKIIKNNDNE